MRMALILIIAIFAQTVAAETVPLTLDVIEPDCPIGVTITADKTEVEQGETIAYTNNLTIKRKGFVIEYWAEWDDGTIAKKPRNTSNTNQKKFTPRNVNGTKKLILKNKLISVDCVDTTSDDNNSSVSVTVHGEMPETIGEPKTETSQIRQETRQQDSVSPLLQDVQEVVYQSSSITSKKLIVWIIVAIVGLLGALLVWRR